MDKKESVLIFGFLLCLCLAEVEGQSCPAGWRARSQYCYRFSSTLMQWQYARDVCQVHGGDLLKIDSASERNWIVRIIKGTNTHTKTNSSWWAGLNNREFLTIWEWADGSAVTDGILNWAAGAPDNAGGTQRCGLINPMGLMDDMTCGSENKFICRKLRNAPVNCDADHGWQSLNGKCYKIYTAKTTWIAAKNRCDHDGAEIVSISSVEEEIAMHEFALSRKSPLWIGLHTVQTPGTPEGYIWEWSNGTYLTDAYWHSIPLVSSAQKNSTCAVVDNNVGDLNAWTFTRCNVRRQYVCRKPEGACLPGWVGHRNTCYQFDIHYKLTFSAATNYCNQQGAELLRITRSTTQQFLQGYIREIKDSGVGSFWIGASDNNHDNGPFTWRNNGNVTYKYWAGHGNNPVNTAGKQDCAYIPTNDRSGHWRTTYNCQSPRAFVCMIAMGKAVKSIPSTPRPYYGCATNWKLYKGQCFYVNDSATDWLGAREACQKAHIWADLVTIPNADIQGFINSQMHMRKDVKYWIGLSDRAVEDYYTWLDDVYNTTYTHWRSHEPNDEAGGEKCVCIQNGLWVDVECNQRNHFICSNPAQTVLGSPPPTTPAMDWSVKCGPGWESNPVTDNCYMFVDQPLSWIDAQYTCQHYMGNLVAIENIIEQNYLSGRMQSMSSVAVWTGGNDRGHEMRWQWIRNQPFPYFNWEAGQPDVHGQGSDCIAMYTQTALWDDVDCQNRNGFICEKLGTVPATTTQPPPKTPALKAGMVLGCKPGWRPFQDYCYQFVKIQLNFNDARARCGRSGGQLASIHSNDEHNFIVGNLPKPVHSYDGFLIGLDDSQQEMMFQWQDGSPMTYTNWNTNEPNNWMNRDEDCVEIRLNVGRWNDQVCSNKYPGYICKAPKSPVSATQSPYQQGCPQYAKGYRDKCYRTINTKMTWQAANAYCVKTYKGTLATVNDRFLQSFLSSNLVYRAGYFWIGLSDTKTQGTYLWTNGARVSYTDWMNTHTGACSTGIFTRRPPLLDGNEVSSCVAMRASQPYGLWENKDCGSKQGFICQLPRNGFTAGPTTPEYNMDASCPYGWLSMGGHCVSVYTDKKHQMTYMEANDYCKDQGGALVSIHSKDQDNLLSGTLLKPYPNKHFWIGLNDRDNESGHVWSDASPLDFTNWAPGEPNEWSGNEDCVEYSTSRNQWNDLNCYVAMSFICSIPKGVTPPPTTVIPSPQPAPECGSDPNWFLYQDTCFLLSPVNGENATMTWYDARDYCTASNANLASIHSYEENNFVLSMITKRNIRGYWIGLNELSLNGYEWTDKTPADFTIWQPNEPNDYYGAERCVEIIKPYGTWNDLTCTRNAGFVCKKPLNGPVMTFVPQPFPAGGCANGFTRVRGGRNKCFYLGGYGPGQTALNWTSARAACQQFGKYYDLASIEDVYEQEFLMEMTNAVPGNVWIGLNDMHYGNNKFVWADNAPVHYLNWARGEPTSKRTDLKQQGKVQNCVVARLRNAFNGRWLDATCNHLYGYVCQTKQDPTISYSVPTSTCEAPGYQNWRDNCYKVSTDLQTWDQAQASCQRDGAQLATIFNMFENAFIFAQAQNNIPYWIGLSDRQVKGLYGWSDGYPVRYTNWGWAEPSFGTSGANGGCVNANWNGRWNDSDCSARYHYACKITSDPHPPTTPLPGNCASDKWLPFGDDCYMAFGDNGRSWPEANYQCKKLGMELVSVHTQGEMDFIFNLMAQTKLAKPWFKPNVWLGLTKGPDGAYKWSDGTAVNYLHWAKGEPSGTGSHNQLEECVEFNRLYRVWNDVDCFSPRAYICKALKRAVTEPVEPTKPPFVEPTNPPFVEPTNPPFVEPTNPPFVEPTNPPFVEPTNPPFVEPTYPPFVEPTYPPFVQPTYPTEKPIVFTPEPTEPPNPFNPFNMISSRKPYNPWGNNPYPSSAYPPFQGPNNVGQTQRSVGSAPTTSSSGMSGGAIAGVIIAVLIILGIIVVALVVLQKSGKLNLPSLNGSFKKMEEDETRGFDNAVYEKDAIKMESTA